MARRTINKSTGRKKNHKYGDLVKVVAAACERSTAMVYRVLRGEVTSSRVQNAIDLYHEELEPLLVSKSKRGKAVAE